MGAPRPWVIVPGIWNSDPEHWQSIWQTDRGAEAVRIAPVSWSEPDPADWDAAITRAVTSVAEPPVLVAHSLGVLAAASWLARAAVDARRPALAGAFLVAPPDPAATTFPDAARGFSAPARAATVPTRFVVSDDDPYCSAERAIAFAAVLGSEVVRVGALAHVNVASGIGAWPDGRSLLEAFDRSL